MVKRSRIRHSILILHSFQTSLLSGRGSHPYGRSQYSFKSQKAEHHFPVANVVQSAERLLRYSAYTKRHPAAD